MRKQVRHIMKLFPNTTAYSIYTTLIHETRGKTPLRGN